MMIKKPFKFTPKKITAWLAAAIIVLTIAVLILVTLFLYNNFYRTIAETKEIAVLKDIVAMDSVDMEKFNAIMDKINKKTAPKEIKEIKNPF